MYATRDYLLLASGDRLFRMEPDRSVLWKSEYLGIDGVIVHEPGPIVVRGEGEWDPGNKPSSFFFPTGYDRKISFLILVRLTVLPFSERPREFGLCRACARAHLSG
jgi:hypothetical protein